jgi:hypothetical protein
MNITQLSEQLKDVPQNRLIDYAKNPNSVVPQFLALAEIQRRQQLSAQAQPPQSTVANDVLSQAAPQVDPTIARAQMMQQQQPQSAQMAQQLPENQPGVAQLPSGVAPQGFANGGIVAFASGDLVDDDEEESREMAKLFPKSRITMEDIMSLPRQIGSGISSLADKLPKSYEATKAAQDQAGIASFARPKAMHPLEEKAIAAADKLGLDRNIMLHALYKETGGHKDPEHAVSKAGAYGPMQIMEATAKDLGIDRKNTEENLYGGAKYLKQLHDKYGDAKLALAAYNAGPGNVDKALKRKGGLDTLAGETRNYIAGLAKGGDIKSYAGNGPDGSDVQDDSLKDNEYMNRSRGVVDLVKSAGDALTNPKNYDLYDMYQRNIGQPFANKINSMINETPEEQAAKFRSYSMTPNKEPEVGYKVPVGSNTPVPSGPATPSPYGASENERLRARYPAPIARPSAGPSEQDFRDFDQAAALFQAENANKQPMPRTTESKSDLYEEALAKQIEDQAASLAKQGKIDQALAVLQTGFGIMKSAGTVKAGERRTFLGDIAGGAEQGINTYAALGKQRADTAKDIMGARLGLFKYGASKEASLREEERMQKMYADRLGMSKEELAEKMRAHNMSEKQHANTLLQHAIGLKETAWSKDAMNVGKSDAEKNAYIYGDPYIQQLAQNTGLDLSKLVPSVGVPQAAIDALRKDPSRKAEFDGKYGSGAADRILGK